MANPYHDELGRFTSKDGMRNAIADLQRQGRSEEARILLEEYQDLVAKDIGPKKLSSAERVFATPIAEALAKNSDRSTLRDTLTKSVAHRTLSGVPYDQLFSVDTVLQEKIDKAKKDVEAAEVELKSFKDRIMSETGSPNTLTLRAGTQEDIDEVSAKAANLLDQVKEEAVASGLPEAYAHYFFKKQKTILGYKDSYRDQSAFGRLVERPEKLKELQPGSVAGRIRNKEFKEIIANAANIVFDKNSDAITEINNRVDILNKNNDYTDKYLRSEAQVSENYHRSFMKRSGLEQAQRKLHEHIQLRNDLKTSGYKAPTVQIKSVGDITGAEIATDKNGISNIWILPGQGEKPVKIVDVLVGPNTYGSMLAGNHLVDNKGNRYQHFTHYANYGRKVKDFTVIVDPTQTPVQNPYSDLRGFSASIDTGG